MYRIDSKATLVMLIANLVLFLSLPAFATAASTQAKQPAVKLEQHSTAKGQTTPSTGTVGLLPHNICKNPELCEAVEVDLLNHLHKLKVPVYVPAPQVTKTANPDRLSLVLGIAVTDALAGTLNKDRTTVAKYLEMVRDDGKLLGVPQKLLDQQYKQVATAVRKGEWNSMESFIYGFKDSITNQLLAAKMRDEASLAMISGGMEGLYIVAHSVAANFTPKAGALLRNRDLVKYWNKYLASLSLKPKDNASVKEIRSVSPQLEKITAEPDSYHYTQKDAEKIMTLIGPVRGGIID